MISSETLEARLAEREGVGPEGSLEGLAEDLHELVEALGEDGAPVLVNCALHHGPSSAYDAVTLLELMGAYARRFGATLAKEALAHIRHDGPPMLIESLGMVRDARFVSAACAQLETAGASVALVLAVADAVVNSGAYDCLPLLDEWLGRADIQGEAADELRNARDILARSAKR